MRLSANLVTILIGTFQMSRLLSMMASVSLSKVNSQCLLTRPCRMRRFSTPAQPISVPCSVQVVRDAVYDGGAIVLVHR